MNTPDKTELQKIAQQVEISRERLQAMEQQIKRLEDVKLEQNLALQTLIKSSEPLSKHGVVPQTWK